MSSMIKNEKGALAHESTGSARLNLFFNAVRGIVKDDIKPRPNKKGKGKAKANKPKRNAEPKQKGGEKSTDELYGLLDASWKEDALDTLKLIFQARDCRGGKGEKAIFRASLLWLAANHPTTLSKNIKHIPNFGTWKDLLTLMPTDFAEVALDLFAEQLKKDLAKLNAHKEKQARKEAKREEAKKEEEKKNEAEKAASEEKEEKKEEEKKEEEKKEEEKKEEGKEEENKETAVDFKKALSKPKPEKKEKKEPKYPKERHHFPSISLAAKWAPSERHGDDNKNHSAFKLALKLGSDPKTALRDYRKIFLSPLRAHLQITEIYMCAKRWDQVPYSLVPSRCMSLHSDSFRSHDEGRFGTYMEAVKEGKTSIKGVQMFPHELVQNVQSGKDVEVADAQWKVIVENVRKMGKLERSIVLSDVSGSMSGTPMLVSIALGLLISEITLPPFTNNVITFHTNPTFHHVKGKTLVERVNDLARAPWGGSTNFQAVFDLILGEAVAHKVPANLMPEKLFVISDMQFDSADNKFMTNYQSIQAKYAKAGYAMPQIIFWNVRTGKGYPVKQDTKGVGMVSGFSPSLLKELLQCGDFLTPEELLRRVLVNPRYSSLEL